MMEKTELAKVLVKDIETCEKDIADVKSKLLLPLEKILSEFKQALANELCFCKIGDTISFPGGDKYIVSQISLRFGYNISLRGFRLKKNGEQFATDNELYMRSSNNYEGWSIVEKGRFR